MEDPLKEKYHLQLNQKRYEDFRDNTSTENLETSSKFKMCMLKMEEKETLPLVRYFGVYSHAKDKEGKETSGQYDIVLFPFFQHKLIKTYHSQLSVPRPQGHYHKDIKPTLALLMAQWVFSRQSQQLGSHNSAAA